MNRQVIVHLISERINPVESVLLSCDTFHVTSFRGRPEQKVTDAILQLDLWIRMTIRKFFKKGIIENPHRYKKS